MSTTVSYKGNTIATVDNETKLLKTQGKYMEADVILTDASGGDNELSKKILTRTLTSADVLPDDLTSIGNSVFYTYNNFPLAELPDNITSIGNYAFYKASFPTGTIKLPKNLITIGNGAFAYCTTLTNIEFPETVETTGNEAFRGSGLTSVTFKEGVKLIDQGSFRGNKLVNVTIPTTVTYVAWFSFIEMSTLVAMTLKGKPVQGIHQQAFQNNSNLITINVPWSENEVAGSPWGATNATINYDYIKLEINEAPGTTVTVTRNGTQLSNNEDLTNGDVLTITCTGGTMKVNGQTFVSGDTFTVNKKWCVVETKA